MTGQAALVRGRSRGFGAATARALTDDAAGGAISYVASASKADTVVPELETNGVRAAAFRADEADSTLVEGVGTAVPERFGWPDIIINNTAVAARSSIDNPDNDLAAFDRQYTFNVDGRFGA